MDIDTKNSVALKGHKYFIDTVGVTISHSLVTDTVSVNKTKPTGWLLTLPVSPKATGSWLLTPPVDDATKHTSSVVNQYTAKYAGL